MRQTNVRTALTGLICASALCIAVPAIAEVVNLKSSMNAGNEVPPNPSKGTGTLTARATCRIDR